MWDKDDGDLREVGAVRWILMLVLLWFVLIFAVTYCGKLYSGSLCGCDGHGKMFCYCLDKECECVLCRTR